MHLGRQMLHELGQGTMDGWRLDHMVVIEHEREVLSRPSHEVVGEQRQHGLWFRRLWEAEQSERTSAKVGVKRLQGGNEIREETRGLIVLRLKREPGDGRARGSPPLGQQGRFPKTGARRDE